MRKEFVYSFLALGAIPVTVNATDVTAYSSKDVISSPTGATVTESIGKLAPGTYTLKGKITTKLYAVTVKIGGVTQSIDAFKTDEDITISFSLKKETDVKLEMSSTGGTVSGAEFSLAGATVNIDVDFAAEKDALNALATDLKARIEGTEYAKQAADKTTIENIIEEIEGIKETYDDYAKYIAGGAEEKKITELENLVVYEQVNEAIATVKAAYNDAVAELEKELTDAAKYLLADAMKELDTNDEKDAINDRITAASIANSDSWTNKTAAADETDNKALIPDVAEIEAIVKDYTEQAKTNKEKYQALDDVINAKNTGLRTRFKAVRDNAAAAKEKEAADNAIKAVEDLIKAAYNTEAQLTLAADEKYTTALNDAQDKLSKYEKAAQNANKIDANAAAIADLQTKFNKAKEDATAKKSEDGKYSANGSYYTEYLKSIQTKIDKLTEANKVVDGSVAVTNTTTIENEIDNFLEQATAAVDYYDVLQAAIADYTAQLEAARAEVENMSIYNDEEFSGGKNYKYELDLLLKNINEIQGEIDEALKKKGEDHWTAMLAIDKKGDTTFTSIEELEGNEFAIVNAADGKALYGTEYQVLAYDTFDKAFLSTNSGYTFKIEESTVEGAYRLRMYTPAGEAYTFAAWGSDHEGYLNSQPATGTVCFVLQNGNQEGTDIENGGIWNLEYVADKGFALKNVGTGKYLKDNTPAKYDDPTYFTFRTVDAYLAGNSIPDQIQKLLDEKVVKQAEYDQNVFNRDTKALNDALDKFDQDYKPATTEKIKMDHEPINTEFEAIKDEVAKIEATTVPAENVDETDKVKTTVDGWLSGIDYNNYRNHELQDQKMVEHWRATNNANVSQTGDVLYQNVENLPNGTYRIELFANAIDQFNGAPNNGKTDIAYVEANGVKTAVTVTTDFTTNYYTIDNVVVSDGKLKMSLTTAKAGTNWHTIQIKSLTQLGGSDLLVKQTAAIAEQKKNLDALEDQAKQALAADQAKAGLQTAVDNKKKEYADSKDADVKAAGAAQDANFDAIVTKFGEFLNDADGDVQKALKELNLEPNNYKAKLNELTKKISDVAAAADINAQIAKVEAAVDKAKNDIVAEETGDPNEKGNKFYLDKFNEKGEIGTLLAEYKKTAADAEAALFNDKKADTDRSAAKKAGLIEQLTALQTKINGLAQLAKDNLTSYTAQNKLAGEVQDYWNEVYLQIAANDESSARDGYLKKLDEIQKTLTEKANAVEENYTKGESVAKDQTDYLNSIKKQIENLLNEQQEGYDEQIAADNQATYDKIGEAVKEAQAAYTQATETYDEYNAAESDLLKNAIAAVKAEKDNLVEKIKEFPTDIATLQEEIGKAFEEVKSPDIFDKDGSELAKVTALKDAMEKAENDFLTAVKAAVKNDCDALVEDYKTQRTNAANIVKTYGEKEKTEDELNTIFKEVDDLITNVETAMSAPKLVELDQALKAAENIPAKIAAIKEAQVDAYLGALLKDIIDNKNLLTDDDKTKADNENTAYSEDKKAGELSENYDNHKTVIEELAAKLKAIQENLAERNELTGYLNDLQKTLDEAKAEADNYLGGQAVKTGALAGVQTSIDESKANVKANTYNKIDVEKVITDGETDIENAMTQGLYDAEIAALNNMLETEIEAQYVLYANDFETEGVQEKAAEYKEQIDNLKKEVADASDVDNDKKDPADLMELENKVTKLLTDLTNDNNTTAGGTAYEKLTAAADALSSDVEQDVTKFTEAQQKDIAAQQEAIDKEIADVKALIEKKKDNIVAFQSNIQAQIDAIKDDIETLQNTAKAAQEELDAKIAAAQELAEEANKTIEDIQKLIDNAKAEIDTYTYTSAEDFKAKFDKLQKNLDDKQEAINAKVADGSLVKEDVEGIDDLQTDTQTTITDVKNTAANRELLGELANLKAQFKAITVNEDDYTLADIAEINTKLEAIEAAIGDDTKGLQKAIADAKTNSKSYESLGTAETPGTLQEMVNEIQKAIDELNEFLADNTLNPVEPEPEVIPGDITGTGEVTDDDFDLFLDNLLNNKLPQTDDPNFAQYDANGDGYVDIADLQAILNLSNGLNWDGSQPGNAEAARTSASFEAGTMNVNAVKLANGNTRLNIVLNSTADYRAFQMDLNLANGMSVAEESGNALTVRSNDLDAIHRIAGYGQVENNGTMLSIDIVGSGNVQFSNIVLTTADAMAVKFTLGEATGINTALAEKDGNIIYDLGGRLMNGLKKGFGIIRGTNGTKKVVK